jgi:hypothetical protein
MRVERDVSTLDTPSEPVIAFDPPVTPVVEVPADRVATTVDGYARVDRVAPVRVYDTHTAHAETVRVTSAATISPAAIVGGIFAVALLVFGGVVLARAGLDGPMDDPLVSVGGFTATATLGIIAVVAGLALLISSLARAREAILLFSIVIGVLALIAAIEPNLGNGALGVERGWAVLVAIASAVVILTATLVPTVRRTASHVEAI